MQASCSERLIIQEFQTCTQRLRPGILVQPSITNVNQWQVNFMPNNGVFKDCILTCSVVFENFPASVPKVIFQPGTLHPLVDPQSNQFDSSEMFSEWNVSYRVHNLLNFVYESFNQISIPNFKELPNQEAVNLLKHDSVAFQNKALKQLKPPPDPTERNELNVPKRWGNQKERVAHILVALGAH